MTIEKKLDRILVLLGQQKKTKKPTKKKPAAPAVPEPHKNESYKKYIGRVLRGKTFKTKDGAPELLTRAAKKWKDIKT